MKGWVEKTRENKVLLFTFLVLLIGAFSYVVDSQLPGDTYESKFEDSEGLEAKVNLEVANTSFERKKGLMNRIYLPKNHGMLFVFDENGRKSFWMKNTYLPLDIIFIDQNMRIVNVEKARPQPFAEDEELKSYRSEGDARYVVEMKRGFAEANSLEKGDEFIPGSEINSCCITE